MLMNYGSGKHLIGAPRTRVMILASLCYGVRLLLERLRNAVAGSRQIGPDN
jgi:hypothetical protein